MGLVSWFARKVAQELEPAAPARPRRSRRFDGAQISRLTGGFATTPQHVNADLMRDLPVLVARARELAKNDDYIRRYIRVVRNNVLGPNGVRLQAKARYNSGELDREANDAVENAWSAWGRRGVCEASGRYSWRDVERIAVDHVARDGEILIQSLRGFRRNDFGYAVQLIDPLRLPFGNDRDLADGSGNRVVMGVERTKAGAVVAYHLRTEDPSAENFYTYGGQGFARVPAFYPDGAPRILHIFRAEEIGQDRGFPPLVSAMMRLKMLGGYEEATLVAARIGASQMLFYKQAAEADEYTGDDETLEGAPVDEVEPGIARVLPPGWDIHAFDPKQPTSNYSDFVKASLRGIAAGLGLNYVTLANDLESVNYSSARVGVLEDREEWKSLQNWISSSLHSPIYAAWLESALAFGAIKIRGQAIAPSRFDKLSRVAWQGRRWEWVDPLKEAQANKLLIEIGARSVSDVISDRGQDPEDVFAEIERDRARLDELGIPVPSGAPQAPTAPSVETTENEDSDNGNDDE